MKSRCVVCAMHDMASSNKLKRQTQQVHLAFHMAIQFIWLYKSRQAAVPLLLPLLQKLADPVFYRIPHLSELSHDLFFRSGRFGRIVKSSMPLGHIFVRDHWAMLVSVSTQRNDIVGSV